MRWYFVWWICLVQCTNLNHVLEQMNNFDIETQKSAIIKKHQSAVQLDVMNHHEIGEATEDEIEYYGSRKVISTDAYTIAEMRGHGARAFPKEHEYTKRGNFINSSDYYDKWVVELNAIQIMEEEDSRYVEMEPRELVFENQPVCIAHVRWFDIRYSGKEELKIISIEGSDVQFHPAMFKPMEIKTGEAMRIQVVFLPQVLGDIEAKLVILTSLGSIVYKLKGIGIRNGYQVSAFNVVVGLGSNYQPNITLHNPHEEVRDVLVMDLLNVVAINGERSVYYGRIFAS